MATSALWIGGYVGRRPGLNAYELFYTWKTRIQISNIISESSSVTLVIANLLNSTSYFRFLGSLWRCENCKTYVTLHSCLYEGVWVEVYYQALLTATIMKMGYHFHVTAALPSTKDVRQSLNRRLGGLSKQGYTEWWKKNSWPCSTLVISAINCDVYGKMWCQQGTLISTGNFDRYSAERQHNVCL